VEGDDEKVLRNKGKILKIFKYIFPNFRSGTKGQQSTSGTSESSLETSPSV
jgi:hypothetical protein